MAPSISAPGCKKILTTAMPLSDWLSICSMPLTVETRIRSKLPAMRVSISSGEMPV